MKLKFYWYLENGRFLSSCEISDVSEKIINCLSGILTDDGALSEQKKISWLLDGLKKFESIKGGEDISVFWDRDSWGSEYIGNGIVRISSLYDDNYFIDLPSEVFIKILRDWTNFNESVPNFNTILNFEYSLE